ILWVGDARFSNRLTGLGIEPFQAPVDNGSDDLSLINRQAAVHNAAADLGLNRSAVDFRVPAPLFLTGAGIDSINDAPVGDSVNRAVHHKGRSFLIAAAHSNVIRPGEPQPAHICRVDLL